MRKFFIVGTSGIPANYGGLETFAEEIGIRLAQRGLEIYVTCEKKEPSPEVLGSYKGVKLIHVDAPSSNLRTMVADYRALIQCGAIAECGDVVYLLGYGVGPFAEPALRFLKRKGVRFWLNPDGLEWKRPRWPFWARAYLQFSERYLLARADHVICDAAAIKEYHHRMRGIPEAKMDVIEYGAPILEGDGTNGTDAARRDAYLLQHDLRIGDYYTYVGRFVPDNNMELMVRGMMDPRVKRKLVIFAKHDESDPFYRKLRRIAQSPSGDEKVIFTGGVYDRPLLQALRKAEYAYFHGHEVGGTNPALVEAMGLGSFIIALNTPFNSEVLADAALYFEKSVESFMQAVQRAEALRSEDVLRYRQRAVERVRKHYNWERITDLYEKLLSGTDGPTT